MFTSKDITEFGLYKPFPMLPTSKPTSFKWEEFLLLLINFSKMSIN